MTMTAEPVAKTPPSFGVTTTVEVITPEIAEALLAHNHSNRRVRWNVVARYAKDMKDGNWRLGGSTIDFDKDGNLLNGQHRLHGCVQAGVPFSAIVVRGLAQETQVVMDVGLKRSLNDILSWRGEVNTATLGSAINLSWRWREDKVVSTIPPTHHEALLWLDRNPSMRDAVRRIITVREALSAPPSAMAAFAHQISQIDYEEAEVFLKNLKEGEGLNAGDPILVLRNWMISQITKQSAATKPGTTTYLALLIKSWNYWITGRSLQTIRWIRGGRNREDFPVLVDQEGNVFPIIDEVDRR